LPDKEVDMQTAMAMQSKARGKGNILLVEREHALRIAVRHALTGEGYNVFEAEDGHQAFLLSENLAQPMHLLVADVILDRGLNGVELSRHLRVLRPGLRVLYLSGVPANPALRLELQARLDSYLSKPFTDECLIGKVKALMERDSAAGGQCRPIPRPEAEGKGTRIFPHGKAGRPDWKPVPGFAG
jgi:DNA-binding response OmpR family regulator